MFPATSQYLVIALNELRIVFFNTRVRSIGKCRHLDLCSHSRLIPTYMTQRRQRRSRLCTTQGSQQHFNLWSGCMAKDTGDTQTGVLRVSGRGLRGCAAKGIEDEGTRALTARDKGHRRRAGKGVGGALARAMMEHGQQASAWS